MERTIWNGTLELGDLAIPVGLASTVTDGAIRFKTLHAACNAPASSRLYCEDDEQLLEPDELAAAWEPSPGEYIVLTADERAALDLDESRRIPIGCFVNAGDLDLDVLARKRYRLVPSKTTVGRRAYALIADAIHDLDVAGIVRFVAWRSEQLAAIVSRDGELLELVTIHFAEDVVDAPKLEPVDGLDDRLRELAHELVGRHTRRLKRGDLDSVYRPKIRALLEAKQLAGEIIVRPAVQEKKPVLPSIDLESALERSVKRAPRRRSPAPTPA